MAIGATQDGLTGGLKRAGAPSSASRGIALLVSAVLHGLGVLVVLGAGPEPQDMRAGLGVFNVHWVGVPRPSASLPAGPAHAPEAVQASASVSNGVQYPPRAAPRPRPRPLPSSPSEQRVASPQPQPTRVASSLAALPPAFDYVDAAQLSTAPRPLNDIEPLYPDAAELQQGTVTLRLLINEEGGVDDVSVIKAFPPQLFEQAAVTAFSKATFAPGMRSGKPVKSQWRVEVDFTPFNRGAVSGQSY